MYQVIKQTDEEKKAMYMNLPKEEIVDMLIQCNKIIESGIIVNQNSLHVKTCDCKKLDRSTAKFPCDGNCEF